MTLTVRQSTRNISEKSFAERAAGVAAFVIPAALGILAASPEPYWLDSPELTAAVQTLGMPHPPGHPLYVMLAKVFTLLPLGGIALRVSLASAIFGASAAYLLFKISFRLVSFATPVLPVWIAALIALSATVCASATAAWWFQCVRQEVYSLQLLLILGAIYPAILFCMQGEKGDDRLLYLSAFVSGLGLCNQNIMTAASLPAFIPILVFLSNKKGALGMLRYTATLLGVGLFGLLPYVLLPLRAASGAAVSLGGVHSISDFWFVISAKVYQKSMADQYISSFGDPPSNTLFETVRQVGVPVLIAFAFGLFLLLRTRRTRLVGLFLGLTALIPLILRVVTGIDPFPADYRGYLLPFIAMSSLGLTVFVAVTAQAILLRAPGGSKLLPFIIIMLSILPIARARNTRQDVDLSRFHGGRLFGDFCLDRAVPGTLILPSDYNLFFTLWSAKYIDGSHSDLFVVNPTLLNYPGYLNFTLRNRPALTPLARSMLVHGTLMETAVAETALNQTLRVEPSLEMDDAALRYLLPDGPLYRAAPQPSTASDAAAASEENAAVLEQFYHVLGTGRQEAETRRMLFNVHFRDAVFSVRRGDIAGAKQSVDAALVLNPDIPVLAALKKALDESDGDIFDIRPFLATAGEPLP